MRYTKQAITFAIAAASVLSLLYSQYSYKYQNDDRVVIALVKSVSTLHPQHSYTEADLNIVAHMYEGLTNTDKNGHTIPGIAKSIDISDDLKAYTFHLRNSKWSDGSSLTALDFIRSFKTALDKNPRAVLASYMDCIEGAEEFRLGLDKCWDNVQIKALDDYTIYIKLKYHCPYFLYLTSSPIFCPVNTKKNVSNGPFILNTWKLNDKIVLQKNPYYWDRSSIKLEYIEFVILQDPTLALSLLQNNNIHYCNIPESVSEFCRFNSARPEESNISFRSLSQTCKLRSLAFNNNIGVLKSKKIREAISRSIDRSAIVERVLHRGSPATGITPPLLAPGMKIVYQQQYLPAKTLLMQGLEELKMSKEDFKDISISFCPISIPQEVIQAIQDQIREKLDVHIKAIPTDFKVQWDNLYKSNFTISSHSWFADYPDQISFLDIFETDGCGGIPWKSKQFDKLIEEARACPDKQKRFSLLMEAENLILNEFVIIPLYYPGELFGVNSNLKGFHLNTLHVLDMSRAYWDK